MTRTLHVCISSASGRLLIDREGSTRDTHCAVYGVPVTISATAAILHIQKLVVHPWSKTLQWAAVDGLRPGSFVQTERGDQP